MAPRPTRPRLGRRRGGHLRRQWLDAVRVTAGRIVAPVGHGGSGRRWTKRAGLPVVGAPVTG